MGLRSMSDCTVGRSRAGGGALFKGTAIAPPPYIAHVAHVAHQPLTGCRADGISLHPLGGRSGRSGHAGRGSIAMKRRLLTVALIVSAAPFVTGCASTSKTAQGAGIGGA